MMGGKLRIVSGYQFTMLIALVLKCSAPVVALAQEVIGLDFDAARSRIGFSVEGFPHSVQGTFKLKSGRARLDMASGKADGAVVIDATSGISGNGWRDSEMRRDILESERYPEIVFAPQSFVLLRPESGDAQAKVHGILTLHGAGHPMDLSLSLHHSDSMVTATGHITIPYVAWGLKDPSLLVLRMGKTVDIELSTVARTLPMIRSTAKVENYEAAKLIAK
jgi:polyisoprenoid-binding protein YceI